MPFLFFCLSGQKDSNLRPPAPKAGALAGLRHTPKKKTIYHRLPSFAEKGGFEPPVPLAEYDSLANCWFQPLTHLSSVVNCGAKIDIFPVPTSNFHDFFFLYYAYLLYFNEIKIQKHRFPYGESARSQQKKPFFAIKNNVIYKYFLYLQA